MIVFKQYTGKIFVALILLAGIILFFVFDLQQYLTLEYLKNSKAGFADYNSEYPFLTVGAYILTYIAITAVSLPGAAILTVAAGVLFGTIKGTILVSFSSTIGSTIAMLVARTFLKNYIQQKFKNQIKMINQKIEEEGAFYLFFLRLVPVFPFFVINLVMGLTPMRVFTFAWVSQIGMLAGTIVYVYAGSELGKIESMSDITSPSLWIALGLIGILPLILKKIVEFFSHKKKEPLSS